MCFVLQSVKLAVHLNCTQGLRADTIDDLEAARSAVAEHMQHVASLTVLQEG